MFFYDGEFGKKCLDQYGIHLLIQGRKHTPNLLVFITFFDAVGSRPTQRTKSLIPFYNVIKKYRGAISLQISICLLNRLTDTFFYRNLNLTWFEVHGDKLI